MSHEAQIRAQQIKAVRRHILDVLKMAYPGELTFADICAVLPLVEEFYLRRDAEYLCDKGYVVWRNETRNMSYEKRSFKLTAKGMEIADRINTDPALEP